MFIKIIDFASVKIDVFFIVTDDLIMTLYL